MQNNSLWLVQIARHGAIGFFSELHLQGNFWFLLWENYVCEFINLFERSIYDEIGVCRIDYAIDVTEWVDVLQSLFSKIDGDKGKRQPKKSEFDTWQSINSRRLKTIYYDKKLDIQKAIDKDWTGKRKYDIVDDSGACPYADYFNSHETITRIEQTRKGEALREQKHSIEWYLSPAWVRSLTLEELSKKGIQFEAPERIRIRYDKKNDEWKNLSESILQERKEHSEKMFLAYARSLKRFWMLENTMGKLSDVLTVGEMVEIMDKATRKERDRIFN